MNIDMFSNARSNTNPVAPSANQIDIQRKNKEKSVDTPQGSASLNKVQPEELLSQIKSVTEDGLYSVRFERNDNTELIVKIFDSKTDEMVRQIPPEEILQLQEVLADLRGNMVDTQG